MKFQASNSTNHTIQLCWPNIHTHIFTHLFKTMHYICTYIVCAHSGHQQWTETQSRGHCLLEGDLFGRQDELQCLDKMGHHYVDALHVLTQQALRVQDDLGQHLTVTNLEQSTWLEHIERLLTEYSACLDLYVHVQRRLDY